MSYNNNWVNELKESYIEEKKAMNVVKKGAKVVAKGATEAGKRVVKALGTRGGSSAAMHLGRGGTYDHVEHEGNNLQEEMALNEDLLMLIDILCEELGIDVEDLLDLDEDYHRQNLNELGDTFKGKLKLAGYAARRFGQLKGLEGRERKMQKEKEGLMDLIRSGKAPPLSHLNKFTDTEYALQNRGNRMARGITSAIRSIGNKS